MAAGAAARQLRAGYEVAVDVRFDQLLQAWDRFINWRYAWAIAQDQGALRDCALATSHGFGAGPPVTSMGIDLLRLQKPELHAWTTSMSSGQLDIRFQEAIRHQIYAAKVNGIIPWAAVQTSDPEVQGIAFGAGRSAHPDAVTLIHLGGSRKDLQVRMSGTSSRRFGQYVTDRKHRHAAGGEIELRNGALEVTLFPEQAVTFVARKA